ncbi:probable 2-oxoglutarate dehydrogenase E1 component DHKTD1 homolog, mitochondrial [Culicoides brevitarsis]|uniref:probable 2-oxoglutarate dehydrogenase E1 component DHKTD1 homolog, mitochondrial n=1 Tax=Culicoides brevitarsis TaxID=469753 RepID=UPI00307C1C31
MYKLCANIRNSQKFVRLYQTGEAGVYGFRPPAKKSQFEVPENVLQARVSNSNLYRWVEAFRSHGHHAAAFNPIDFKKDQPDLPELKPSHYGLNLSDLINTDGILSCEKSSLTVSDLENVLKSIYCGNVGAEFAYISSTEEREWLSENFETSLNEKIEDSVKREIAELMLKSQAWDNFLATKFPTVKRYGGEGNESFFAFFRELFACAANVELQNVVLGMPHRGRLNLLTILLGTRPVKIFHKYRGNPEFPPEAKAMCDIAQHFHTSEDLVFNGKTIHVAMPHNPSHLEAVNPVSMGKTRSKQQTARDGAFSDDLEKNFGHDVLNVQIHGDGAFPGQGINQECLLMSGTPHFQIGGTIHLVVNNQVAFTTPSDRGKSSKYCTDLAKTIEAPVFHVNADDPEALTKVTKLAFDYQRRFRKDVFIDLNCFRRWGHNEMDDPTFTNPAQYEVIHARPSIPDFYAEKLISEGVLSKKDVEQVVESHMKHLNDELAQVETYQPDAYYFKRQWHGLRQAGDELTYWDTGCDWNVLSFVGRNSVQTPKEFNVHPHLLKTFIMGRMKKIIEGTKIDWATAEALAFGSLMYQGHNVRLSGEDVGRGTFSHRHAMLIDQKTNEMYIPLNAMRGGLGGKLELAHSILSEEAVLGFEYGYAIDNPNNLVIWEAQFGDFFNGAQIIIDTFIATGETKWMISNGLVMLLPHGLDGAASEHSSCRMERFLQMTDSKETSPDGDSVNMQVVSPTTPAQYFHLLRRQMIRDFRKPLVVVAPKTLLRLSEATSNYLEFLPGTQFKNVLGDQLAKEKNVKKVIFCTGKHYYNLNEERLKRKDESVAIVRVESLCPFPSHEIQEEIKKYKNATTFIWSQEEHRNSGAWTFIKPRFENLCGKKIQYTGRYEGATTAVGVGKWHRKEAEEVVSAPFDLR